MNQRPSRPMKAPETRTMRDAWGLDALEREGLLSPKDCDSIRQDHPEWVAIAAQSRGVNEARLIEVMAAAAKVRPANLDDAEAAAVRFVPEALARRHLAFPLYVSNRTIRVATANPMDMDAEQAIRFIASRDVEFVYATPAALHRRIDDAFRPENSIERLVSGLGEQATLETVLDRRAAEEDTSSVDAPAAKLVDATIADAVRQRASDIHFEPGENGLVVRYRIDGVLVEAMRVPRSASAAVVRRIKVTAQLDISDPLHPHDGRAAARVDGKPWDLRISTVPIARLGEKVVIRLLDPGSTHLKLSAMGLLPDDLAAFTALLGHREGIVLVTGPTGSGKTSTLYAALDVVRTPGINVVTVEDPVEYRLAGVNQIEVNDKQGFSFAAALRSVLRQDPDVVLLGEIRDLETATTAWQAALSGHFVLSTLHTNDSASSIMRLRDIGIESYKISAALKGVVAQRLVRKLCNECAVPVIPTSYPAEAGTPPAGAKPRAPKGCSRCAFTGYRGRFAIEEILTVDSAMAELIASEASIDKMVQVARQRGMHTLWDSGVRRFWSGDTGLDEVKRVVGGPPSTRADTRAAAPSQPAAPDAQLILVADDDPVSRLLSVTALQNASFRIAEARDGLEALEMAQRLKPDLLLLDMEMPRLDGMAVLGALRSSLHGRSLPIVVLTSLDDAETERRCLSMGASDFLVKGSVGGSLVPRVQAVLMRTGAD